MFYTLFWSFDDISSINELLTILRYFVPVPSQALPDPIISVTNQLQSTWN